MVSLSPQSVSSIAVKYGLSAAQAARRLSGYFKRLGADRVLDTSFGRAIALLEWCVPSQTGPLFTSPNSGGPVSVASVVCNSSHCLTQFLCAVPCRAVPCIGFVSRTRQPNGICEAFQGWRQPPRAIVGLSRSVLAAFFIIDIHHSFFLMLTWRETALACMSSEQGGFATQRRPTARSSCRTSAKSSLRSR